MKLHHSCVVAVADDPSPCTAHGRVLAPFESVGVRYIVEEIKQGLFIFVQVCSDTREDCCSKQENGRENGEKIPYPFDHFLSSELRAQLVVADLKRREA